MKFYLIGLQIAHYMFLHLWLIYILSFHIALSGLFKKCIITAYQNNNKKLKLKINNNNNNNNNNKQK